MLKKVCAVLVAILAVASVADNAEAGCRNRCRRPCRTRHHHCCHVNHHHHHHCCQTQHCCVTTCCAESTTCCGADSGCCAGGCATGEVIVDGAVNPTAEDVPPTPAGDANAEAAPAQ